jgi:multiple sugar transport system permease protein
MRRLSWFLLPVVAGGLMLVVVPAVFTIGLGFTHYDALGSPRAAGVDNFRRMWSDPIFWQAVRNSLIFASIAVPLRLGMALGVGLLLSQARRGVGAARTSVALPSFVPDVAYALLWLWVFNPLYGPLAAILRAAGLPGTGWLLGPWGARMSIVIMSLFQVAEAFIIVVAVRNEIPGDLYELAGLEGASAWQTFRRVTLPLLAPTLVLLAARDVAFSFQSTFVPAMVLYEGGPNYATTVLPLYVYQNAFEYLRFGYAGAMTAVMFVVTAGMVGIQLLALRHWRGVLARA